jgi:hypothetical protein
MQEHHTETMMGEPALQATVDHLGQLYEHHTE